MKDSRKAILWISMTRIIATFMIFLIHYYSVLNWKMAHLDPLAISLFCFISGVLACGTEKSAEEWIIRRLKAIMIPYWLVIAVVIALNEMTGYKESSWIKNIIVIAGFGMYVKDRIYMISWFITMINLLYANMYLFKKMNRGFFKFIFLILSFWVFYRFLKIPALYFFVFYFGYFIKGHGVSTWLGKMSRLFSDKTNAVFFVVQSHCYSFFLIHGGILLLLVKVLKMSPSATFFGAILLTGVLSIPHKYFSDLLIKKIG